MAALEMWRLFLMFCSDRYAPQSLLLQYVIFTLHFLSIAPYMEPSLFWGLSSDTKGLAAPRQLSLNLSSSHCLCKCRNIC